MLSDKEVAEKKKLKAAHQKKYKRQHKRPGREQEI
jgi:hypothetical protein